METMKRSKFEKVLLIFFVLFLFFSFLGKVFEFYSHFNNGGSAEVNNCSTENSTLKEYRYISAEEGNKKLPSVIYKFVSHDVLLFLSGCVVAWFLLKNYYTAKIAKIKSALGNDQPKKL